MYIFNRSVGLVAGSATLAVALFSVSCRGGGETSQQASSQQQQQVIQVDGSSTVYPITEAVAEEFQKANPGTRVTVGISGTGGGFQKFCRDEIDIADASRPIRPSETEACAKTGVQYVELPVAYDGLAVVVHPKNSRASSMTGAELKRLWDPGGAGEGHEMEPGPRRLARSGDSPVRSRRRFWNVRL